MNDFVRRRDLQRGAVQCVDGRFAIDLNNFIAKKKDRELWIASDKLFAWHTWTWSHSQCFNSSLFSLRGWYLCSGLFTPSSGALWHWLCVSVCVIWRAQCSVEPDFTALLLFVNYYQWYSYKTARPSTSDPWLLIAAEAANFWHHRPSEDKHWRHFFAPFHTGHTHRQLSWGVKNLKTQPRLQQPPPHVHPNPGNRGLISWPDRLYDIFWKRG